MRALILLGVGLLLGGCASVETTVDHGRSLREVRRYFVVSNPNDNHALDRQIATILTRRGRTAAIGPLTMLPDDAQAVVTYQDHWSWDFGEHLDYLKITVRDPLASQPYASVTFSARVPVREQPAATVAQLVEALLEK
ncbi:MAG: hypothetical protein HYX71_07885 [Opitutae bacterium]|nr:hypothetical protein [Opitutae bacterium]